MAGRRKGSLSMALGCLVASSMLVAIARAGSDDWNINADTKEQAMLQSINLKNTLDGAQSGSGAVAARSNQLIGSWWVSYKNTFNKQYANPGEDAMAMRNFVASVHAAVQINTDANVPFWQAPNEFADMDYNGFKAGYLMTTMPVMTGAGSAGRKMMDDDCEVQGHNRSLLATAGINWVKNNKVTSVKNQGQCGSCWSFAATGAMESAYLIVNKLNPTTTVSGKVVPTIDLAEQQLVSCANGKYNSFGCNGGSSDWAMQYVIDKCQATEALWGYTAKTGTCNTNLINGLKNGQYVQLNALKPVYSWIPSVGYVRTSEKAMMARANLQPFVVYIDVEYSFQIYKQGVYTGPDCKKIAGYINHAVLLVGYYYSGKSDASSYWIIKNSWGTWWGEQGYIRIAMSGDGVGVCNVNYYGIYPNLSFTKNLAGVAPPAPPPASPKPSPKPSPKTAPRASPRPAPSPPRHGL